MAVKVYEQLAAETKRVLAEKGWSLRRAERQTGVGSGTIQHMTYGKRPGAGLLIDWALAIDEDAVKWLLAAGYEVKSSVDDPGSNGDGSGTQAATNLPEVVPLWQGLNNRSQEEAKRFMEFLLEKQRRGELEGDEE